MSSTPTRNELARLLGFAVETAHIAGQHTLNYFRRDGLAVERKGDDSPVTVADRETEQLVRERIEAAWPTHGIVGEEFGETRPDADMRWIVDPIDGTKSFIHGVPLYTVLLALEADGEPILGVVHCPPLDETVAAARGLGCQWNGQPCHVSARETIVGARIQTTDFGALAQMRPQLCAHLLDASQFCRTWGDAFAYLLVATGRAEVALDPEVNLWDTAALRPIVEEAGGRFTDLTGRATAHAPTALATNGPLHQQVLDWARLDDVSETD